MRSPFSNANNQFHRIATVGLMLQAMGVLTGLTSPGMTDTDLSVVSSSVHLTDAVTITVLYVLVLSPLVTQPQKMQRGMRSLAWFVPLLSLCLLSAAWSHDPSLALRRSLFLLLTTVVGVILGLKYTVREIARMLGAASVIHLGLVAVLMMIAPHMVFSYSEGHALRGLTTHKNVFGFETGLAFLVFMLVPFRRFSMLRWPLMILAGGMLLLSRSTGSLVATATAVAFLPLLYPLRYRGAQRIALGLITATLGGIFAFTLVINAQLIPQLFSKDATLTGRTELWALIDNAILQRPLLGYGYDSFWTGLQGDSLTIIRSVGWLVPTAHNGYRDLLLGIGFIGALLFAPLVLQCMRRAVTAVAREQGSARYFPAAFLAFWLIYNLNESALLTRAGLVSLLFVSIYVATSQPVFMQSRVLAVSSPHRAPLLVN